jgi:nucleoside-diphosphate-sugar epimerase
VVAAVQRSLTVPAGGIFNLSLDAAPTWNEYFRRYAAALGAPAPRPMSRLRLGAETRLISPLLKIAELAGARGDSLPPAIRPWLLRICRHRIRMNVARAEAGLGMHWRPLDNGLSDTAKWFRDRARP